MSTLQKTIKKLFRKPIPTDITYDEFFAVAEYYGFSRINGGKHPAIRHTEFGIKIPIPIHGNTVEAVYIKQFKYALEKLGIL